MLTLASPIASLIRLKESVKTGLTKLGITTVGDLLYHFPSRYADASTFTSIAHLTEGNDASVRGTIIALRTKKGWKSNLTMTEATIEDVSGKLRVVWFNQPYLSTMLSIGRSVELTGKVTRYHDTTTLTNPIIRSGRTLPIDSHDSLFGNNGKVLTPIYPETKGVSSAWVYHAIARALARLDDVPEHLPETILAAYSLPALKTALIWIHAPKTLADAQKARKRFAFDEIFTINCARQKERAALKMKKAYRINTKGVATDAFIDRFPFTPTTAQMRAMTHVLSDLDKDIPMSRLLEGDVGSGKTAVAAVATYATVMNRPLSAHGTQQSFGNLQVAYMAPTEILATQHFESFIEFFRGTGIAIALITGSGARKFPSKVASSRTPWTTISRAQLRKWIANGEIPIVIGTHTLIQKSLTFKHLALAIIDEQHRFGLTQRMGLAKKDVHLPHLLSMTATPIPRTLALTLYGDLDISLLDELPLGRKHPITRIVTPSEREAMYDAISGEMQKGRQLYVICPRIDAADPTDEHALIGRSVSEEAAYLKADIFPTYRIGILHSKMPKAKKEPVMHSFATHELDILVATSVVEVGVNVPNATLMIIEGAERFGLAQLHQLRGRIMRSTYQPYCYLFAESKSEKTKERLTYFLKAKSGFELAEYDLHLRGGGELTGTKQWGVSDMGMEALRNRKLVEAARESATALIAVDPTLAQHPLLAQKLASFTHVHFE
ncbi:MAG TPA: ATP-dependent DNA helicase RecG [Candidatus Paceibacterota bacterium]|nr:ATP-dependent DNA helicase RecG [Candidatus Paceibacterota bacterium]